MRKMTSLELVLRQCGTLCGVLVLLCGLLIRSLIPIGYMPDPEAWRNGQVTMTFCTADGTTISLALEDLFDAPKHHPEQGGLATCPCCFIYDDVIAISSVLEIEPTTVKWASYPQSLYSIGVMESAQGVRGPPLGARAPPELTITT